MARIACANQQCAAVVCLDEDTEQRRRKDHATFYCPVGHSNYFPGLTDEEREIKRLKRLRAFWEENAQMWQRLAHTCPWPGCGKELQNLRRHLQRVHGMPTLAAVREEEEAS